MSVCVKCQADMTVLKNGAVLVRTVGKEQRPQSLIQADVEACPWCGVQIIAQIADEALEHWQQGFQETMDKAKEQNRIYFVHEKIIPVED